MLKHLYHGTSIYFEEPDLSEAADFKDFGRGYYLTTNIEQAERWAIRTLNYNSMKDVAYLYEYEFDTNDLKGLRTLELLQYNKKWLDFIACNRTEIEREICYDLIYDRMADSRGMLLAKAIREYQGGFKTAAETLLIAKFKGNHYDQYCFKTSLALNTIKRKRYATLYNEGGNPKVIEWFQEGGGESWRNIQKKEST